MINFLLRQPLKTISYGTRAIIHSGIKGTSLKPVRQKQIDEVADKMNTMPMCIALQGKSPIEQFDKEYKTMKRYRRAYQKRELKQNKTNSQQYSMN